MRVALLAVLVAAPAFAQPVAPEATCTYTDCAIRLEQGYFGTEKILTGPPEQEIRLGSVGLLGGGLVSAVEQVPVALDHAETAQRRTLFAALAVAAGVAAMAYGVDGLYEGGDRLPIYLAGSGLVIAGSVLTVSARRERARAVWEYNRAVAGE